MYVEKPPDRGREEQRSSLVLRQSCLTAPILHSYVAARFRGMLASMIPCWACSLSHIMFTLAICTVTDKTEDGTNDWLWGNLYLPCHKMGGNTQVKKRGPNYLYHPSHYYLGSRVPGDISTRERLTHHGGWFLAARWVSQFLRASFFCAKEGEKRPIKQNQSFHFQKQFCSERDKQMLIKLICFIS